MRLKPVLFILSLLAIAPTASAVDLRLGMAGGMGTSIVSARGVSQSESPGMFGAYVDYAVNSRQTIGLEHIRTFATKPVSTGVSISGLTSRWYFLNPAPSGMSAEANSTYLFERYIAPFFGVGVGFNQSSLLPSNEGDKSTNSVGVYGKVRLGMDIPWMERVGLTAETSVASTVLGDGSVTMFNANLGLYFYF